MTALPNREMSADDIAGAVHTVPEHHANQHADHHSQPRKIATRSSHGESSPCASPCSRVVARDHTHPIMVDLIH
jgi:hypothetical protein